MSTPKPRPPKEPLFVVAASTPRSLSSIPRRPSRCVSPRKTPLEWIYYKGNDGSVAEEIQAYLLSLDEFDRELALASLGTIIDAAALGTLEDGEDIKPMTISPEIWELRFRVDSRIFRLYFAEPALHPENLVALLFHEKSLAGSQEEIDTRQSARLGDAAVRFKAGESSLWGNAA